jgi:pimeloyl-ACP methyl ester carboxylesterase
MFPSAIYANKFNHLFWRDVHDGEAFGFAKNQVTPFTITTPDGEVLYAWNVLPTGIYARHEKAIRNDRDQNEGPVEDFTQTVAFKLLTSNDDPPPRVVVSCMSFPVHCHFPQLSPQLTAKVHGNAGDIAQGWRPDTIRSLVSVPNTYVFTIDYRGFGHSTGSPDEAGVIMDGVTLVEWIMREAKVPSERVVIMGQSL